MPVAIRAEAPAPPRGRARLGWYMPGLLWMISSVGSGSVLFTPRVGSRYGYELLWAALIVIALMWVMIREVGRYTVVTGRTILDGYREVPGPYGWPIWAVLIPGLVAGVTVIAGVAALAGSALMIALPGSAVMYGTVILLVSAVLVLFGRYRVVERVTAAMSVVLLAVIVTTAIVVGPSGTEFSAGLVPSVPQDPDWYFILPWVGFILAGAGGILWFSYWVAARGYGGAAIGEDVENHEATATEPEDEVGAEDQRSRSLRDWTKLMSVTAALGVITGGAVIVSFLILGTELLRPEGVVPEGIDVAEDLALLLSEVWGQAGYWLLIVGAVIALWGTVISNQDGWPRTFADSVLLLRRGRRHERGESAAGEEVREREGRWGRRLANRRFLHNAAVVITVTLAPLIVLWTVRDPVDILSVGGIVTAALTPLLVALTLYVNRRHLPRGLRPGWLSTALMALAGVVYGAFAVVYFADLLGAPLL